MVHVLDAHIESSSDHCKVCEPITCKTDVKVHLVSKHYNYTRQNQTAKFVN